MGWGKGRVERFLVSGLSVGKSFAPLVIVATVVVGLGSVRSGRGRHNFVEGCVGGADGRRDLAASTIA